MSNERYISRRQKLMAAMKAHAACSQGQAPILVLTSWPVSRRNGDVDYSYRADSDLFYFTGLHEEESALVIVPGHEHESVLFVRERDPLMETWHGRRVGTERAKERFSVDAVFDIKKLSTELANLMRDRDVVFANFSRDQGLIFGAAQSAQSRTRRKGRAPQVFVKSSTVTAPMRLQKDEHELASLRQAARASVLGHRAAMIRAKAGVNERELESTLISTFLDEGAARHGYPPIVAAGENALILHYVENDAPIKDGDVVLIDAGAEVDMYTADITRTFPVSGTFTKEQAALYDVCCEANERAIALAKPGANLVQVDECARRVLAEGLLDLKLIKGSVDEIVTRVVKEGKPEWSRGECALDKYYMHGTSHWLGSDVHDVGAYHDGKTPVSFVEGMVFTVEPGLYMPIDDETIPAEYRGIGIRIEDDIVITAKGNENLTEGLEKTRSDVERVCSK